MSRRLRELISPQRVLFALALGLILLVTYSSGIRRLAVPDLLRFVPAEAPHFVVGSALADFWPNVEPHLVPFWTGSRTELADELWRFRTHLEERCIGLQHADGLYELGIDPERGIGLAWSEFHADRLLLILPTSDQQRFADAFRGLQRQPLNLSVEIKSDSSELPKAVRLSRSDQGGGRLCVGHHRKYMLIDQKSVEVAITGRMPELHFQAPGSGEVKLEINCSAVYPDGNERPCDFAINGETASRPITVEGPETVLPIEELEFAGNRFSGFTIESGANYVVFASSKAALISGDRQLLSAALRDPNANIRFHRGHGLFARSWIDVPLARNEGAVLLGRLREVTLPLVRALNFHARLTPEGLTLQTLLETNPTDWRLERELTAPWQSDQAREMLIPDGAGVTLTLRDSHLSHYLNALFTEAPSARDTVASIIGGFQQVLDQIAEGPIADGVSLSLLGVRKGVPQLLMGLRITDPADADALVIDVQQANRRRRDREVLQNALWAYLEAFPEADLSGQTAFSHKLEEANLLQPEPAAAWSDFRVDGSKIVNAAADPATRLEPYQDDDYRRAIGGFDVRYLVPPVTDNDLRYRMDDDQRPDVATEELLAGRYRLAAFYDDQTAVLWIGMDAEMLTTVISNGLHRRWSAPAKRALSGVSPAPPRLAVYFDPSWLVAQGTLSPNSDVKVNVQTLLKDFSAYSSAAGVVYAKEANDGLYGSFRLGRE